MSSLTAAYTPSALLQGFKYCRVAPAVLWIQDYLLTLDDEFMTTAKERWRLARLLFIITRYLPIVDLSMTLYVVSLNPAEAYKCYPLFGASGVTFLITILASEGLLFIRTSVLWHDNRRIKLFVAIMFGCLVALTVVLLVGVFLSLGVYSSPSLDISDCLSLDMNPFDTLGLIAFAIFELMIGILTANRAIVHCRSTRVPKLLKALCQGNLVYTIALFCACIGIKFDATLSCLEACSLFGGITVTTVANICVLLFVRSDERSASLNQMQLVLHSVLASRILFDLRDTRHGEDHQPVLLSVLQFATSPATVMERQWSLGI